MNFTASTWPRDRWPNFSFKEMSCRETDACELDEDFMDRLQGMRNAAGKGFVVTSGYRSPEHSVERDKEQPGAHTYGKAVDISCSGAWAHELTRLAMAYGFTGVGLQQTGPHQQRFIHIDTIVDSETKAQRPWIWTY